MEKSQDNITKRPKGNDLTESYQKPPEKIKPPTSTPPPTPHPKPTEPKKDK